MSIPAFFPLGTHCTWRLDEPTNVCLIYRVLKHYKQYSRTYQHENLASVDFKGIFVTLVMYQASCFTGVSEWQNTGSRVLAPKMLTGMVQTRTSDPEESSQCCDNSMDRVEEAWVWVMAMERWGHPVLTAEGRKASWGRWKGSAKAWPQSLNLGHINTSPLELFPPLAHMACSPWGFELSMGALQG